jgi:hypothetical protein
MPKSLPAEESLYNRPQGFPTPENDFEHGKKQILTIIDFQPSVYPKAGSG